jgi:hypothetical protein
VREGWNDEEYFIFFEGSEISDACARYDIEQHLPGFTVLGLRGWDDLIVRDQRAQVFAVPTVPIEERYLDALDIGSRQASMLESDERFKDRIKWYVTPLVFGGSAEADSNIVWVDHSQHGELVRWWNARYRELKSGGDA